MRRALAYIAVALAAALCAAGALGLAWCGDALAKAADAELSAASCCDLEVRFPYGLTDDDLAALGSVEGVSEVGRVRMSYELVEAGGQTPTLLLVSQDAAMCSPTLVEGRLPEGAGQLAVESSWARAHGVAVGDVLRVRTGGYDAGGALAVGKLEVTGLVRVAGRTDEPPRAAGAMAPDAAGTGAAGFASGVGYVSEASFDARAFGGAWSCALVRCAGADGEAPSGAAYREAVSAVAARVAGLGGERAKARYDAVLADAQKARSDAQARVDEAMRAVEAGRESNELGEQRIAEGLSALEETRAAIASQADALARLSEQYAAARAESERAQAEAKKRQEDAQKALDEAKKALEEAKKSYEEARKREGSTDDDQVLLGTEPVRLADVPARLEALQKDVDARQKDLDERKRDLQKATDAIQTQASDFERRIADAQQALDASRAVMEERDRDLSNQRAGLNNGWHSVRSSTLALESAQAQLSRASRRLDQMAEVGWTVGTRDDTQAMRAARQAGSRSRRAALALAPLMVACLAACHALSCCLARAALATALDEDERAEVRDGWMRSIVAPLVGAAAVGAVVGVALAALCTAPALGRLLQGGVAAYPFDAAGAAVALLATCAGAALTATLGCRQVLGQSGRDEEAPGPEDATATREDDAAANADGETTAWRRALRRWGSDPCRAANLASGAALGAAVAVALCVGAEGVLVRDAHQRAEVFAFDRVAVLDARVESAAGIAGQALEAWGARVAPVFVQATNVSAPEGPVGARLVSPANDDWFRELFHVVPAAGGEADLSQPGAWVSQGLGRELGVRAGDEVVVAGPRGEPVGLAVAGLFAHHLPQGLVVAGAQGLGDAFASGEGEGPGANALLVDSRRADGDGVPSADGLLEVVRAMPAAADVPDLRPHAVALGLALAAVVQAAVWEQDTLAGGASRADRLALMALGAVVGALVGMCPHVLLGLL